MEKHEIVIRGIPCVYGVQVSQSASHFSIVVTQLPENTGLSITNAIEHIVTAEYFTYTARYHGTLSAALKAEIAVFEHYPPIAGDPDVYDQVFLTMNPKGLTNGYKPNIEFSNPQWRRASKAAVMCAMRWA